MAKGRRGPAQGTALGSARGVLCGVAEAGQAPKLTTSIKHNTTQPLPAVLQGVPLLILSPTLKRWGPPHTAQVMWPPCRSACLDLNACGTRTGGRGSNLVFSVAPTQLPIEP